MSRASAVTAPQVRDAAPLFAALGDETRLRLIVRLSSGGPGSITQLSAKSAVSRQAITKHLRVLSDAGLVRSTRRGRESVWELETNDAGARTRTSTASRSSGTRRWTD